jgi:HSP20 family protein
MAKRSFVSEGPFSDFDKMFEEMRKEMDEIMWGVGAFEQPDSEPLLVSYRKIDDADTEPVKETTDSVRKRIAPSAMPGDDEPLVDVREKDGKVTVLIELPGTIKEDIDVHVSGKTLSIDVDVPEKSFSADVQLPCTVKASSTKASYRNGVLEVVLDKAAPRKRKGTKVGVE